MYIGPQIKQEIIVIEPVPMIQTQGPIYTESSTYPIQPAYPQGIQPAYPQGTQPIYQQEVQPKYNYQ